LGDNKRGSIWGSIYYTTTEITNRVKRLSIFDEIPQQALTGGIIKDEFTFLYLQAFLMPSYVKEKLCFSNYFCLIYSGIFCS
jgi:hypothetical protein